jgi:hypothetical protein
MIMLLRGGAGGPADGPVPPASTALVDVFFVAPQAGHQIATPFRLATAYRKNGKPGERLTAPGLHDAWVAV